MSHKEHKHAIHPEAATLHPNSPLSRLPVASLTVGMVSFLIAILLMKGREEEFYFSFHVSWIFFLSIALGALFFILIQFITKAGWSVVLRRFAENIAGTLPFLFVCMILMFCGASTLFHHWVHPEPGDVVLQAKAGYLNLPFFYVRSLIYFAIWLWACFYLRRHSLAQDVDGSQEHTYKLQTMSVPFAIFSGLAITFASFDWIMSLDPHWFSTIFGLSFFASCLVAFYCALAVVTVLASKKHDFLGQIITTEHYHDLGKLIFSHSCFWAYTAFCQYFLIWFGNLPEETIWYAHRAHHGWEYITLLVVVGYFIVPFIALMSRKAKRNPKRVFAVALWVLAMHFINIFWLVMPTAQEEGPEFNLFTLLSLLSIGGIFVAIFTLYMKTRPILAVKDPRLKESISFENV